MQPLELLDFLHAAPFLRRLPPSRLDRLASASAVREIAAGEALLVEGEPGASVFLLLTGSVTIAKAVGTAGEQAVVAVRGAGTWVGEMALLDDAPRFATATAREPTTVLEVPREAFFDAILAVPEAALDLLRTLTSRLRESDRALIDALTAKARALEDENLSLARENRQLRGALDERSGFEAFIGVSAAARRVREAARQAAASSLPVLLLGETGTGKEILARAIHAASDRSGRPFVAVNCALLSETLLESELFGHVRGAFTGAAATQAGLVEAANGGTLFLDEVGEMPRAVQAALLRFLELGEYRRLGDPRVRRADVRLVAATNVDLEAAVREGLFRPDLLYRLDVMRIEVPPLRERRADLPLLVRHLSERLAARHGVAVPRLSAAALDALAAHAWPGNVRELESELARLQAAPPAVGPVEPIHLSARVGAAAPEAAGTYTGALRAFKAQVVARALRDAEGSHAEAARRLGVHRSNLSRMMRELGLRAPAAARTGS